MSEAASQQPPQPSGQAEVADHRSGSAAIIGRPNVGKSTLLNVLVGEPLAIATPKPGTTRLALLGVHESTDPEGRRTQIAFYDTPGLERPRSTLSRILIEEAKGVFDAVDVFILVVEAPDCSERCDLHPGDKRVLEMVEALKKPIVLALNKVDRLYPKNKLLPLLAKLGEDRRFSALVPISATQGIGIDGLIKEVRSHLGPGLMFPQETLTNRPMRFFVAEAVREAIFLETREEVPYGVGVVVSEWVDGPQLTRIGVTIVVEKESHKGIVIGAQGQRIKRIGQSARQAIEKMIGRKVFLHTFVKVIEGWTEDPHKVRRIVCEGQLP
ncbi:MAG: GTPase Era [Deltaproteobacteria bacterium]|nr:GTPase Era [Sandaracinaceae bacterium]MCX7807443.1 GTPase Era [Deltaproteobacteria bacterium]MDW8246997.1 GTPase Era [Sandaracinaceae bacterium]